MCVPTIGDHTSQPQWKGLCQGSEEENSADSQTPDLGKTMCFFPRPWDTGAFCEGCFTRVGSMALLLRVLQSLSTLEQKLDLHCQQ